MFDGYISTLIDRREGEKEIRREGEKERRREGEKERREG